jgi:hypothetical protein
MLETKRQAQLCLPFFVKTRWFRLFQGSINLIAVTMRHHRTEISDGCPHRPHLASWPARTEVVPRPRLVGQLEARIQAPPTANTLAPFRCFRVGAEPVVGQ